MPRITVLDIAADPSVTFKTIPIVPPTIPLSGLTHYWSPDSASLSGSLVNNLPPWRGGQTLEKPSDAARPSATTLNGKNLLVTSFGSLTYLRTPAAGPLTGDFTSGVSISLFAKSLNLTQSQNLCLLLGFRIRILSTGFVQIQKADGTTATLASTAPGTDYTTITITQDRATTVLKLYVNGVYITQTSTAIWSTNYTNTVGYIGAISSAGSVGSDAHIGDVLMYNRALTAEEVASVSLMLRTKYGLV